MLRDMGREWKFLIGTYLFKWLETPDVNYDRSNLYLCEVPIKFNVFCRQEWCLNFMQILVIFLRFEQKKRGGGLTPKGKIMKPAHFVFQSYWVVPSTWLSFIENGEMACITSAWSSRKLSLNFSFKRLYIFQKRHGESFSYYRSLISRRRCNFWQSLKKSCTS